ncbi:MAG: hypothetical protein IH621_11680, partial [Krumholzibacteria bacterium]|nr:hypothetical protein [Candidatus Krumholzibacteria bacterium]
ARVGPDGGLTLVQELGRGAAEDLVVVGGRVHAAVTDGLATFDISRPDTVLLADLRPLSRARSLAAFGDLVYVGVAPPGARLKAWDFAGGGEPALVVDAGAADLAAFSSLVTVGGTLLVGDRWLRTIDVADPLDPVFAPPAGEPAYPQGLAVCGDHAVVVDGPLAAVYALGDGTAVTPEASYYLGQSILHLTAGGRGTVYLARNASGLVVLQPATGTGPALVHPAAWFGPLAASDSLLVTGAGGTLRIYGLADPALPAYLGELDFGDYVRKVSVAGSHALVSLAAAQLVLVDLSDPTSPQEVARDPDNVVFRSSGAVAWADSFGLDYHSDGLLRIVQPGAGAHLETVGAVANLGEGRSLALQGPVLYALSGEGWGGASSVDVLDLSDPRHPVAAGRARRPEDSLTHLVRGGDFLYALGSGGIIRLWPDCRAME